MSENRLPPQSEAGPRSANPNGAHRRAAVEHSGPSMPPIADWVNEAVQRAPATACMVSLVVGVGLGALIVHSLTSRSSASLAEDPTLRRLGKRAVDSLAEILPANLAQILAAHRPS